jgi:hypothetical protein
MDAWGLIALRFQASYHYRAACGRVRVGERHFVESAIGERPPATEPYPATRGGGDFAYSATTNILNFINIVLAYI